MGLVLAFNRRNAQPEFNTPASISGTVREGQTLSVTWEVIRARRVTVEWTSYTDIAATQNPRLVGQSTDLLVPSSDVGRYLVCRVYASNAAGSVVSVAGPTIAVESANAPDPYFSVLPSLSGNAVVGETMTLSYTPVNAITEQRQWYAYTNPGGDQTGRLTLGTGLTQSIPAGADGYYIGALVQLFDADGDMAEDHTDLVGPVTPGAEDPGAPELPRVTTSPLPPAGWDKVTPDAVIASGTNLQTWLNSNAPISTAGGVYVIEMEAGATWKGQFTFPSNFSDGVNWVVFRTSGYANLPAEGNRLQPSPANAADLAVIEGLNASHVRAIESVSYTGRAGTIVTTTPHGVTGSKYFWVSGITTPNRSDFSKSSFNGYYSLTRVDDTTLSYTTQYDHSADTPVLEAGAQIAGGNETGYRVIQNADVGGLTKVAFIGIRFRPGKNTFPYQSVYFPRWANNNLLFYQCRFDTEGDDAGDVRRIRDTMLYIDGNNHAVSCCDFNVRRRDYFEARRPNGFLVSPDDGTFPVRHIAGSGLRVYNNRLAGGISMFVSDNYRTYVPSDITIDKNYMLRPAEWQWTDRHKNCFEFKGVERFLMEGNIVENAWMDGQSGALLVLKNVSIAASDITVRNNILRGTNAVLQIEGKTGTTPLDMMRRLTFENNLVYDINPATQLKPGSTTSWPGEILYVSGPVGHLRIQSNTLVAKSGTQRLRIAVNSPSLAGFRFQNNVVNAVGSYSSGQIWNWNTVPIGATTSQGLVALNNACADYIITNNVWTKRTSQMLEGDTRTTVKDGSTCQNNYYYIGNHLQVGPSASEALFVDYDNKNFRINPSGSLATAASDGGPPGADIDVVEAATANVETGTLS